MFMTELIWFNFLCSKHLLLSLAAHQPMVNHSILAQLLKHRHFAQVSSAADSALLSPNLRPPAKQMINLQKFTKAVETPGSFQTIWYIHMCKTQFWTMYGPLNVWKPCHCCLHCQKHILENSCGHSKPKSLSRVNRVSFSEWGEHCKRPTIKDGWNPTAPRNDPVELALTAR